MISNNIFSTIKAGVAFYYIVKILMFYFGKEMRLGVRRYLRSKSKALAILTSNENILKVVTDKSAILAKSRKMSHNSSRYHDIR